MSGGTTPPYRVIYSESVRGTLLALGEKAKQLGLGVEFAEAIRTTDELLHSDPLTAGEPTNFLSKAGLHVRVVGSPYFYWRYAVDEDRRLAYVLDCIASARLGA